MAHTVLDYARDDLPKAPCSGPAKASFCTACVASAGIVAMILGERFRLPINAAIAGGLIYVSFLSGVTLGVISLFDQGYRRMLGVYGLLMSFGDVVALIVVGNL